MKDKTVHLNLKPSGGDFEFYPEKYSLYHSDCFDVFKHIENNSIDAIIADLPYGTTACKWDSIIPFKPLWKHYERVIKDNGAIVLFGSQPFTSALIMSNPKLFKYEWIWEKSKASNFLNANKQPLKAHENIIVFSKNTPVYFPQKTEGTPFNKGKRKLENGKAAEVYRVIKNGDQTISNETGLRNPRSVQYFITAESEGKLHPTQKPINLLEYLINTYTNKGECVLDNTMGSGTTGVACINTGRKFIGIEKEKKYYDVACSRISRAVGVLNSNAPTLNFEQSTEL